MCRSIELWNSTNIIYEDKKVLEIGARGGGLSLWFALNRAEVVCSDLKGRLQMTQGYYIKNIIFKVEYHMKILMF